MVGSLAVAIIAYVFAAFLYKIKGMPMVKNTSNDPTANKYIKCTSIDTEKLLFTEHPVNGMVKPSVYEAEKRNKYGKIFWPYLSEIFYPVLNTRKKKAIIKVKMKGRQPRPGTINLKQIIFCFCHFILH